jgi:hypothetical protein
MGRIAGRRQLDLDDFGAHLGEQAGGVGPARNWVKSRIR